MYKKSERFFFLVATCLEIAPYSLEFYDHLSVNL